MSAAISLAFFPLTFLPLTGDLDFPVGFCGLYGVLDQMLHKLPAVAALKR